MKGSRSFTALLVLVALVLTQAALAQSSGCELLTRDGVADTSSTISDNELASSYRRWFCDKRFSTQDAAETYSISGMVPFKGVPVKLGFDATRNNWTSWSQEVCSDEQQSLWRRNVFVQDLKTINVELAKVISDCITRSGKGLFVWLERTSDVKFKLAARFDTPIGRVDRVKVNAILDPEVDCSGQALEIELGSPNTHRWLCQKRRGTDGKYTPDAIQIIVNSPDIEPIWGSNLTLPSVNVPPPPAPTPPTRFPIYVTGEMVYDCISRGRLCAHKEVILGGVPFDKGVIYTQPYSAADGYQGSGGHSEVSFDVPDGAHLLRFSVGDPYTGDDCADPHKKGVIMYVQVDGVTKWGPVQLAWRGPSFSGEVALPRGSRKIKLIGQTGDGPVDCDDAVWVNVRFEE